MSAVECIACGHVGPKTTKGSFIITLILLIFGIFPGVVYEIWRRSGGKVCSACKSSNIKLYVPRKHKSQLIDQSNVQSNVQQIQCPDCREYIRYDARKCKHCGSMMGG